MIYPLLTSLQKKANRFIAILKRHDNVRERLDNGQEILFEWTQNPYEHYLDNNRSASTKPKASFRLANQTDALVIKDSDGLVRWKKMASSSFSVGLQCFNDVLIHPDIKNFKLKELETYITFNLSAENDWEVSAHNGTFKINGNDSNHSRLNDRDTLEFLGVKIALDILNVTVESETSLFGDHVL